MKILITIAVVIIALQGGAIFAGKLISSEKLQKSA
jgi:hypothetical protein